MLFLTPPFVSGISSSLDLAMQESGVPKRVISPVREDEAVEGFMQKKFGGFGSAVGRMPRLGSYVR